MSNIISQNASLLEAIKSINSLSGHAMTLFAVDADGRMVGTLTDGDIRRALLAGVPLDAPVARAVHSDFRAIAHDEPDAVGLLAEFRRQGIRLVPRLDADGHIAEIIDLDRTHNRLPVSAILMAGGKGERLRPLTLDTPKPLLQIEGKAIIDYNIEALAAAGVDDITVTTRYLAHKIADHFASPVAGVQVKCVEETAPLGTIGAAALVDLPADGDTLVMNSDLITTVSFEEMYMRHRDSGADVTIAVFPYQVSVPYAILDLDGERVAGLSEKPTYSYYANAGIYIFRNEVLKTLDGRSRTDATDLIDRVIAARGHVAYYPIKGIWIDVGSPADFRHASELLHHSAQLKTKS